MHHLYNSISKIFTNCQPKNRRVGISILFTAAYTLLLLAAAVPTTALFANSSPRSDQSVAELKAIGDYRKDLKTFVKKSKSREDDIRVGAILSLCILHDQLVNDPRYDANSQLQGFRAVAGDRLKKCKREIELQLLRYHRKQGVTPETNQTDGLQAGLGHPELNLDNFQFNLAVDMQAITSLSGGPINLWNYTGNPGGPLCDYGPELVNLIVNTINPEFWRRNGGDGIIEYYQPLRIIVVGASSQVHHEIGNLLRTMRRQGR